MFSSNASPARWLSLLPILSSICSAAPTSTATAFVATQTTPPLSDPFYVVPSNISSYAAGEVVRSRQVNTYILGVTSYELFYRTNDQNNNADGTVATVWVPAIPQGRILSYQYAEDADNLNCDPSYAFVDPTQSNNSALGLLEAPQVVPFGLSQGAYVVNPDAEGSKSAWLVGGIEGHATLDAIRATINYFKLTANKTQIGMYGYSGGAHETVWAATLATSYAPELKLVGAAYGGTPTDLRSAYALLNGGPEAVLAGAAIFGLGNGYATLNSYLNQHLTSQGKQIAQQLRSSSCLGSLINTYANFNFSSIFNVDILAPGTPVSTVLARESLLMNVSSIGVPVPKFPRYEYHGTNDTTVPYPAEKQYVQQQCAHGADITFVSYQGQDHGGAAINGLGAALNFLAQSFAGTLTPPANCGAPTLSS